MNTLLAMTVWIIASAFGGVKTGALLGVDASDLNRGLYEVDVDTGNAPLLHELEVSMGALAVAPDGTLYGVVSVSSAVDELVTIDPVSGDVSPVGTLGFNIVAGLTFAPDGTLYGFDNDQDVLIAIDLNSGKGVIVGYVGDVVGAGLASTSSGTLYLNGGVDGVVSLLTIDVEGGEGTVVGPLGGDFTNTAGLEVIGEVLYASAHDSIEKPYDSLVSLNSETGEATKIGSYCPFEKECPYMHALAFLPGAGDADRDGDVDFDDYEFFVDCFGSLDDPDKSPYCAFLDADDDGDIDCDDWEAFIPNWTEDTDPPSLPICDCEDPPCACEGDANGDGLVDPLDSGFVLSRFGCPVGTGDPSCDAADVNADGLVDPLDAGYVLARFGTCE